MVGRSFLMVSGLSGTLRDSAPQPGLLVLPQRCVSECVSRQMLPLLKWKVRPLMY